MARQFRDSSTAGFLAILFACLLFSKAQAEPPSNATVRVAGLGLKWIRADKEANLRRLEPIPEGKYFQRLAALAAELRIHLVAGRNEADGELRYHTTVLIGPGGKLAGKYRRHALEPELVRNTPGTNTPAFDTGFGHGGFRRRAGQAQAPAPPGP